MTTPRDQLWAVVDQLARDADAKVECLDEPTRWNVTPRSAAASPLWIVVATDEMPTLTVGFGRSSVIELWGTGEDRDAEPADVVCSVAAGRLREQRMHGRRRRASRFWLTLGDGHTLRGSSNWLTGWVPPWLHSEVENFEPWSHQSR